MLRDPIDAEQLGMMEKHKANDYWNKGRNPGRDYEKPDRVPGTGARRQM